jgi:hypothetical protein
MKLDENVTGLLERVNCKCLWLLPFYLCIVMMYNKFLS